jgi:hypothetical protein
VSLPNHSFSTERTKRTSDNVRAQFFAPTARQPPASTNASAVGAQFFAPAPRQPPVQRRRMRATPVGAIPRAPSERQPAPPQAAPIQMARVAALFHAPRGANLLLTG